MSTSQPKNPGRGLPKRYLLESWVLVLSAVAFMDRTNLSIDGVSICREFGIDNAHSGWIAAHFGWGASFLTATVLSALGAIVWLIVNPSARLDGLRDSVPRLTNVTEPMISAGADL